MLVDGNACDVDLAKESSRLATASHKELEYMEVSPAGYGLHWPDLDEDLSIDGLIGVRHESCLLVAEDRERYGFTLLEVLVAMGILMMIVLMMATLFHQSSMAWDNGMRQAEMGIQARAVLSMMRKDLEQAVASKEYHCSFGGGSFEVYVLGTTTGDVRTVKRVKYSGKIDWESEDYDPGSGGGYFGSGFVEKGELLESKLVDDFSVTTPSGTFSTNLPPWVEITITLEKKTPGAAGIRVWTKGRNIGSDDERKKNVKKKRLYTGDWDTLPWL
jgi:competence protein ComGC